MEYRGGGKMKFKQQEEETPQKNPFLDSIIDLIVVNKQFRYAIESIKLKESCNLTRCTSSLSLGYDSLMKLAVCLNSTHKMPAMTVEYAPAESIEDLKRLEEKYYNMLKEIAKNALEDNEVEVLAYLYDIIRNFEHYFCTLDEGDDSGETGS